jgi:hypothetical protein
MMGEKKGKRLVAELRDAASVFSMVSPRSPTPNWKPCRKNKPIAATFWNLFIQAPKN